MYIFLQKLPYAMNLHYGNSKNVLVKELTELQRIPLKFIRPKVSYLNIFRMNANKLQLH